MARREKIISKYWKRIVLGLSLIILAYVVLFHGLIKPANFSQMEVEAHRSAYSLSTILDNPIDAPAKLAYWLPQKLNQPGIIWTRYVSAFVGLTSVTLLFVTVRHLFSRRIAILTSILFVFSSGFLHATGLGAPFIWQIFGITLLLAIPAIYQLVSRRTLLFYLTVVTLVGLMYIPAMPWFVIIGTTVMFKRTRQALGELAIVHRVILPIIFLAGIAPLVWGLSNNPSLSLALFGLPESLPSLTSLLDNGNNILRSLFWKGTGPAELMLIGAPILSVVEIGLIITGAVVLIRNFKLRSNLFLFGGLLLTVILMLIGGVSYIPFVPFLYLLLANGIFYLIGEWLKVFPFNPIANALATTLVFILVASSALFHIRSYYIAWPHSEGVHKTFTHQDVKQ